MIAKSDIIKMKCYNMLLPTHQNVPHTDMETKKVLRNKQSRQRSWWFWCGGLPSTHSFLLVRKQRVLSDFSSVTETTTVVFSHEQVADVLLKRRGKIAWGNRKMLLPNSHSFLLTRSVIQKSVIIQPAIQESVTNLSPHLADGSDTPKVSDKNKRIFLKVAGIAVAGIASSLFFPKKASALIMGSSPTTGVVGVKNASNTRINPATEETVSTLATEATTSSLLKPSDLALNAGVLDVKVISTSGEGSSSFSDSADVVKSALVDADRHVQVDVLTSALPTSASTEDTLETISFGGVQLAIRLATNSTDSNIDYVGEASIGTATSSAVWRIKKIDSTTGIDITWADGNGSFDNIWNNREGLTYS